LAGLVKNRFVRSVVHFALKLAYAGWKFYASIFRPVTLGVRALVLNDQGHVLLIRHTYAPGWFMPGGGVGRDETLEAATARELYEEAGIRAIGDMNLVGAYANFLQLKSDHVIVYEVPEWEEAGDAPHADFEIAEAGFFPPDALPEGTTPGTRQRLDEYFSNRRPTTYW
jgi:8-oxo-dGTP pyrophosphatase MutT (NUDIX family)